MILNIRQFILILSVLVFAACEPSDERIEITETREWRSEEHTSELLSHS